MTVDTLARSKHREAARIDRRAAEMVLIHRFRSQPCAAWLVQ
jgi:hypothetical protein